MLSHKHAAAGLLLLHTMAVRGQAPFDETETPSPPDPVEYVGRQALSYVGYIMLGIFLLIGGVALVFLCFRGDVYRVGVVDNLKLQVPRPGRALVTDLREVVVDPLETVSSATSLGDKAPPVSHAYLAWRRSQLNIGVLLYVAVLVINIIQLHKDNAFDVSAEKSELSSDAYAIRDRTRTQLLQFIPLAQTIFAIFFYSASAWRWVSYHQSIRLVAFGWFFVFFLPFIYFFVPWMDIVSPKEQVQGLCKYTLNTIETVFSSLVGTELQLDGKIVNVNSVCSGRIDDMANTVTDGLKLIDTTTGNVSSSQLILTFVGLLLRYIVYFPFLLGALEALKSLAPGVLGLMLGLQKGLRMSKLMFPGVRVTSWMLIILQASALPIVMCIMALLLVVVGTIPVMATAVLITASMGLFLAFSDQLLRAVTREKAQTLMTRLTYAAIVLQILGLGFLVLGIYMADHLVALKAEGVAAVKNMLSPLFISRLVVQMLAGMFVSKVVFVDVVLHIIISTYIGVYDDASEMRQEVFEELTHFANLFPKYESYKPYLPGFKQDGLASQEPNSVGHHLSINHGTQEPVAIYTVV
eukprot:TRINITY_DN108_c0_g1_i17.p1 TRINITY_DN108_c0_g1~~TRINITY_DN108_c0_g1_i17.p1  ORF type:complete len:580 (+),score=177.95 TRINITY_DN108_c0_g1_i17:46-1785(+)